MRAAWALDLRGRCENDLADLLPRSSGASWLQERRQGIADPLERNFTRRGLAALMAKFSEREP